MRVIGTAGHVDHGKSTLIAALTGVHPDRLKEEQEREMTIDLGFGWLTLPNGEEAGIVDVPGHRDFIENMLAGVSGLDAAMLVVAADEGVMPQTREHLAILDLLQIPTGLVALTKTDLVPDNDWLELIEADLRATLQGTVLQDAPIVRLSAKTGVGLGDLLNTLTHLLENTPHRPDLGRPRLPIDRVFTLSGFGTVVTGTLSDGSLALGDEVEILPSRKRGRVRGLQVHKKKTEQALPGSRTAVNISGIASEEIHRGEVLTRPGQYQPTRRLDAHLRLLPDVSAPLKHGTEVKFFTGASETIARLRLLGTEELFPGQSGWMQIELRDPIVVVRGDRYILRRPSPAETLGGGTVIDPHPKNRHKRFDKAVLQSLQALAQGSPADILLEAALALGIAPIKEIVARSHLESEPAAQALQELLESGRLLTLEAGPITPESDLLVLPLPRWNEIRQKALQIVTTYHQTYPLRRGIPREELKSKMKLPARPFNAILARLNEQHLLHESRGLNKESVLHLPSHEIRFDNGQQAKIRALMRKFAEAPFAPPALKECQAEVGEEIVNALIESGELIAVSPEIVFRRQDYEIMVAQIRETLQQKNVITLAEVRDLFHTSRKYAQALLEHLDASGVTLRQGDVRMLKK